jgi:hypothetical protein
MRKLFVHLCLGTAHQSLVEEKFSDAQFALEFARDTFPDLVGSTNETATTGQGIAEKQKSIEQKRKRREEVNLEILDRLLPT